MNIFDIYLDKIKKIILDQCKNGLLEAPENFNSINVDIPPKQFDCDISTNVAMVLSKINQKTPIDLANQLSELIKKDDININSISVAKPGFINIKFENTFWNLFLKDIINSKVIYGSNPKEKKQKYLVEFVSANPTGPLHVGHCRGAILGDVISNILKFNNHDVVKEYYVNDYGNQIINFTKSVYLRIREILNKEAFPKDNPEFYPGDYIIQIANNIINENKKLDFNKFETIEDELVKLSVAESLKLVKTNLNNLGIMHDNFVSETNIIKNKEVEKVVNKLSENKFVYEGKIEAPKSETNSEWIKRNQLLFKSTDFGDDKDRALQKSDKTWTYFAGDVAYHNNKLNRKFDTLINILGADHSGYNVRVSKRSHRGYRKFQPLIRPALQQINRFAVQGRADAKRLVRLGAPESAISITGNLKFDVVLPPSIGEAAQSVRRNLGRERPVWLAGSTHEGEESQILEAFARIRTEFESLLLVIVPRHPQRFNAVFRLCTRHNYRTVLRSQAPRQIPPHTDIYLVDTMGELPLLIAAADVAFIGGSLVPVGGHNILEACAAGIPVVFGRHMFNFAEIADLLLQHAAGIQVMNDNELSEVIRRLLADPLLREQYANQGRELVEKNRGALQKICALIGSELSESEISMRE